MKYDYEVFCRLKRGSELYHVGTVSAESDRLAKVYAMYTFDEENWIEMSLFRRDQAISVRKPKGLFEGEGVESYA